ncbi:MAG: L-threonylcarbamoyladenylate synthase [bacterium]|nr:L-threonylcarbamoyladenylate synthase [bacterium]MDE0439993.1 L-threonylcarbamoyladenylate synthase [bacterium]
MSVEAALRALRSGLIVGVPTDTVYGVAVDPADPVAVRALFELKGRGEHLPLAVLVASFRQAEALVDFTRRARTLVQSHWPGAFTAIVRRKVELAGGVGDHRRGTLAVRMPDHPMLRDLLRRSGPLAVTSANLSGSPPALDAAGAREALGDGVAVYLEGRCHGGRASTVVDLTLDPPAVLRQGPIQLDIAKAP